MRAVNLSHFIGLGIAQLRTGSGIIGCARIPLSRGFLRRRGIDPYAYLKDVLTRLSKMTNNQIPEVTPAAWAKARLQQKAAA